MITVITAWYNEEFLASIFLRHYSFADEIIILLDESTNDDSVNIINRFKIYPLYMYRPLITVKKLVMPNGMDDQLKQSQINSEYKKINTGWVIIADADEFIKIPSDGLECFLEPIAADVVKVDYVQMYQNKSELPLNRIYPPFEQRRYGKRNGFERWRKPAVVKAGKGLKWTVGHHEINARPDQIHNEMLLGAHWYMADQHLAIERRINGRKNRMSPENYKAQMSAHNFTITEHDIEDVCRANMNCPRVF